MPFASMLRACVKSDKRAYAICVIAHPTLEVPFVSVWPILRACVKGGGGRLCSFLQHILHSKCASVVRFRVGRWVGGVWGIG